MMFQFKIHEVTCALEVATEKVPNRKVPKRRRAVPSTARNTLFSRSTAKGMKPERPTDLELVEARVVAARVALEGEGQRVRLRLQLRQHLL